PTPRENLPETKRNHARHPRESHPTPWEIVSYGLRNDGRRHREPRPPPPGIASDVTGMASDTTGNVPGAGRSGCGPARPRGPRTGGLVRGLVRGPAGPLAGRGSGFPPYGLTGQRDRAGRRMDLRSMRRPERRDAPARAPVNGETAGRERDDDAIRSAAGGGSRRGEAPRRGRGDGTGPVSAGGRERRSRPEPAEDGAVARGGRSESGALSAGGRERRSRPEPAEDGAVARGGRSESGALSAGGRERRSRPEPAEDGAVARGGRSESGVLKALGAALRATYGGRSWRATVFTAQTALLGTISFAVVLALVVTGASTVWLVPVGLPVLWLALSAAHQFARFESWRYAAVLGVQLRVRQAPVGQASATGRLGRAWARMWARLRTGGCWLETVYAMIVLPVLGWAGGWLVATVW